ncbi:MAG: hypothetical protein N3B18_01540 [Desulfobacterota bacterium]|nr:hypothetical protein [Thermodesulfobacteriota bacterium]
MIVPMKKVSLVLYHAEREAFLRALQDLGVVHINELPEKDRTSLQELESHIKECERILAWFRSAVHRPIAQRSDMTPEAVLDEFERLEAEHIVHEQHLQQALKDAAVLQPWGEFDPALMLRLREAGACIAFYAASPVRYEELCMQLPAAVVPIRMFRSTVLFMVVAYGEMPLVDAEEVLLPEQSLAALRSHIDKLKNDVARIHGSMAALGAYADLLSRYLGEQKTRHRLLSAALDGEPCADGTLIAITGWCPAAQEKKVAAFLKRFSAWCAFSEPGPDDDVPVLLQNGPVARLFEPITRLYMLPHYRELDPTPLFAPFFTLFVGLCIGDVAYGAIMMLAAVFAYCRVSPALRQYAILFGIFGAMTCVCGFMLNSFFGQTMFGGPGIAPDTALFPEGSRYCLLSPYKNEAGVIEFPAMSFSLLLGFLQLMIAMTVQAVVFIRQGKTRDGCRPLSYIVMLLGMLIWGAHAKAFGLDIGAFSIGQWHAGALLLAMPAGVGQALLAVGVMVLLLSAGHGARAYLRPVLGLWDLYQFLTGLLGDMLSYIRLFALGLCSGLLGSTFNGMALGIVKDGEAVNLLTPWIIGAVLLLVLGHCLNFSLSLVGAFVHPLRLTFVEFFKNLGFAWGGKPFTPFCKETIPQHTIQQE